MPNLNEIVDKIKQTEDGLTNTLLPVWRDSIKDNDRNVSRLHIINAMLIIALVVVSITSMIIIKIQQDKYTDFLSQFDFQNTSYIQDLDSTDGGNAIINSGITVN